MPLRSPLRFSFGVEGLGFNGFGSAVGPGVLTACWVQGFRVEGFRGLGFKGLVEFKGLEFRVQEFRV